MSGKVVLAYSGGLDSTLIAILLKEKYGFKEVIPVAVDVGQGDAEINIAKSRAEKLGLDLRLIDAKEEFAVEYIARCIKANGSYEGYPMGTSMTRVLIASKVMETASEEGAEAVAHGCTGKGNDQFRMEATFRYYNPNIRVIAPVRELNLSRSQEEEMLREYGIDPKEGRHGVLGGDVNMWSHSIGSGQVEDLSSHYYSDYIWCVPPEKAPDEPLELDIKFRNGVPIEVNNITDPVEMIIYLNEVGGANGVGEIDILEDGIIGLKSRELYEAPAATILLHLHKDLEQLTLTKEELQLKWTLDSIWSYLVYHGMWLHPLRKDIDAFNDATQRHVNGEYRVQLYKGNIRIMERSSDSSLFRPELRSIKRTGFDQRDSTGAVKIYSLKFQLLNMVSR
ncbi:MAG TPA: argininosuccinate synthase [Candidatus Bathyarchaeota archaeon]|nr:argininosuccinate synthase [Candidatus Bathyarchaeota archaeon]